MTATPPGIVTHAGSEPMARMLDSAGLPINPVTENSGRVDGPAALFRGWAHIAWWLCAWNAAVPIRLVGMYLDGARHGAAIGREIGIQTLEQTSWAVATYVMFRLALQAHREPPQRVLAVLGMVAVPLTVLRYWGMSGVVQAIGRRGPLPVRALWYNGPFYLFLMMAAAALGLLVVYMQRERDNAVLRATLQAELASARLQTLRLQLNPHFLFNALNSIASLVHSDAAKADAATAALSSFLRASLSVTRGEETTLENELRLVDAYLEIESFRFEWLTVDLDVPDALRTACVPAFVLQLLVENAIRHGLAPCRTPGRVMIAARMDGNRLELCVSDDGVGLCARSGDASLGIGLQNVRARLAQLYGSYGTLTIEPSTPHGTVATVHIPYRAGPPDPTPDSGET